MKKKQIRFMRPSPQSTINDIFLRGAKAERTMMIIVDGYFRGQPDSIKPEDEIPSLYKLGIEAEEKGLDIFKKIMKQLKDTNWKFRITTDSGTKSFIEIMKKYTNKNIKITNYKSIAEKTRSLIVFARRNSRGDMWKNEVKKFLQLGKQVCVVDEFGVKRYPRKEKS